MRRDGNAVADWLAKNCDMSNVVIRVIDVSCSKARQLLMADYPGHSNE